MQVIAMMIAAVYVAVVFSVEYIEEKDRKKGLKVDHRDYTVIGFIRLMFRHAHEQRARKKKEKMETTASE